MIELGPFQVPECPPVRSLAQVLVDAGVDLSPALFVAFTEIEATFRDGVTLDTAGLAEAYAPLQAVPREDVLRAGRSMLDNPQTNAGLPDELRALLGHLFDATDAGIPVLASSQRAIEAQMIGALVASPGFTVTEGA